jgi:enediyne biosynthesis protein E5
MSPAVPDAHNPLAPKRPKKGLVPPKFKPYLAPILISCILLVGEYTYGILESYWHTALAILSAIALEMVMGKWATGKWPHLASAYITGISVGILVRSNLLWPYVVCSLLSISSKYAIRVGGRHLFNPSNLGVCLLLFLVPNEVSPLSQQWGNDLWPPLIIFCLGALILYSLGRLHITMTYVLAFSLLSCLRSWLTNEKLVNEIGVLTQPSYLLFMFFMITDPKTTTRTWKRQCLVAALVAVVETLFRLYGSEITAGLAAASTGLLSLFGRTGSLDLEDLKLDIHAPYYALFLVAPVTNLLEIWWESRQRRKAKAAAIATPVAAPSGDGVAAVPSTGIVAAPAPR